MAQASIRALFMKRVSELLEIILEDIWHIMNIMRSAYRERQSFNAGGTLAIDIQYD